MAEKPSYFRSFDGMCWPAPGERLYDLEYALRHGTDDVSKSDRQIAASVIQAYCELIAKTTNKRNCVVRELRKGPGIIRESRERMTPTLNELQMALDESVFLQAHYAELLNGWDGGKRMIFDNSAAWISRLRECGKLPTDKES